MYLFFLNYTLDFVQYVKEKRCVKRVISIVWCSIAVKVITHKEILFRSLRVMKL